MFHIHQSVLPKSSNVFLKLLMGQIEWFIHVVCYYHSGFSDLEVTKIFIWKYQNFIYLFEMSEFNEITKEGEKKTKKLVS
jgi:hypothetical protein